MREFARLFSALDETNKTLAKVGAVREYLRGASGEDAAWAVGLLTGRRPPLPVSRKLLRQWAMEASGVEEWLFEECYAAVGDLSETMALLLPDSLGGSVRMEKGLAAWMGDLADLKGRGEAEQREFIEGAWRELSRGERFVLHKLIGGSFRVGISKELVLRAVSEEFGVERAVLAQRMMGDWSPSAEAWTALISGDGGGEDIGGRPYPFCLAHAWEGGLGAFESGLAGEAGDWMAEWKWDGIRAQLVRRGGETFLWSRGEELIGEAFPEVAAIGGGLEDGTVLDGEILAWDLGAGRPLGFSQLQRRIGRKSVGRKLLGEVPCVLVAFDLLEWSGEDWRGRRLGERRARLEELGRERGVLVSERVFGGSWAEWGLARESARGLGAEGLMLKRLDSAYGVGRARGDWWKWKVEAMTIDAVLVYAMRGSGKRASLYTDYTFAVWDGGELVPVAKAYSGLTDAEIAEVDRFVRRHGLEKFGPVRTVKPELVFEIAFEGIQASGRHKSGVALRFPRIHRWRRDKGPGDADTLEQVRGLLGVSS